MENRPRAAELTPEQIVALSAAFAKMTAAWEELRVSLALAGQKITAAFNNPEFKAALAEMQAGGCPNCEGVDPDSCFVCGGTE